VSRENARAKGMRYLVEHRLTVLRVSENGVQAECRGTGAVHRLGWQDGSWACSCPTRGVCSHLFALTVRESL
jgi:uncharacterized Zn finger protein